MPKCTNLIGASKDSSHVGIPSKYAADLSVRDKNKPEFLTTLLLRTLN